MAEVISGKQAGQLIQGKTIKSVKMNAFNDGRMGEAFAPVITFEDGSKLLFLVQETEDEYGVNLIYTPKALKTIKPKK